MSVMVGGKVTSVRRRVRVCTLARVVRGTAPATGSSMLTVTL